MDDSPNLASNEIVESNFTPGGNTVTQTDGSTEPLSVVFRRSQRYLSRPARRTMTRNTTVAVEKHPNGPLLLRTRRSAEPLTPRQRPEPLDPVHDRVVTFDTSVLLAGIDPVQFRPDDALFISAMLYLEQAVYFGVDVERDQEYIGYGHWDLTHPVPVDHYVSRIYQQLCSGMQRLPILDASSGVRRTDLVCAATAILYDASLYTTRPEAYKGLGLTVRTLKYGPVRNAAARKREDEPLR